MKRDGDQAARCSPYTCAFIEDSSWIGYDGGQNVRKKEDPVGQRKPGRKAERSSKRGIRWPRWTGFRGKTFWDWLQLFVVPLALAVIGFWFAQQQEQRQQDVEAQR